MGTIKDGVDVGVGVLRFWVRFKGKRVRVWPSELTLRVCSESAEKWVKSVDFPEPPWWERTRQEYRRDREAGSLFDDPLIAYAAKTLTEPTIPHLETIEEARLFEGTITDLSKDPPGLLFTDIDYWLSVPGGEQNRVEKVRSSDEGIFLPIHRIAKIDFVAPGPRQPDQISSWPQLPDTDS